MAAVAAVIASTSCRRDSFELSLYEYTSERDLVEIWKAEARTIRYATSDRSIGIHEANVMGERVATQLKDSGLLWPCGVSE